MTDVKIYLTDGADWQAQMVLAYIRGNADSVLLQNWKQDRSDLEIEVGRYENFREQGYIFSIFVPNYLSVDGEQHQMNWAVYMHRNADILCVLTSTTHTLNTPTIEEMFTGGRGKWDYDKEFQESEIIECGKLVIRQMSDFVEKYYKPFKN